MEGKGIKAEAGLEFHRSNRIFFSIGGLFSLRDEPFIRVRKIQLLCLYAFPAETRFFCMVINEFPSETTQEDSPVCTVFTGGKKIIYLRWSPT